MHRIQTQHGCEGLQTGCFELGHVVYSLQPLNIQTHSFVCVLSIAKSTECDNTLENSNIGRDNNITGTSEGFGL